MYLSLLGSPLVTCHQVARRVDGAKTRSLLVLLALNRGKTLSRDYLADELWEGSPPPSAEGTLHAHVSRLRRVLAEEAPALVTVRPGYRLDLSADDIDVERFQALHTRALTLARAGNAQEACQLWQRSLDLWRSHPRDNIIGFTSAAVEIARLEELFLQAREGFLEAQLALGHHSATIPDLKQLVQHQPGRERLWALLITALHRDGQQAEALATYSRCRTFLLKEFGVEPNQELQAMQAAVLAPQPVLSALGNGNWVNPRASPTTLPTALLHRATKSDLVGREEEIRSLSRWWGAQGTHRFALVSGEPGIGKTRLVEEFALAVHAQSALVLWGQCLAEGTGPYEPLVVALRDHLLTVEPAHRPVLTGRAGQLLARLLPQMKVDALEVSPAPPLFDQYRLFEALAALVQTLADGRDVLLVLEDLHWADASSLKLIQHLVRHPARMLLLGTVRPGPREGSALAHLLASLRHDHLLAEIQLRSLDTRQSQTLLELLGVTSLPQELVSTLTTGAVGNPYILGEIAMSLYDDPTVLGRLTPHPVQVSATLNQTVLARVSQLGPTACAVLDAAAIIGHQFDLELLAAVSEEPLAVVFEVAEAATAAGVVTSISPNDGTYRFTHALVRAALDNEITTARRASLHHQISSSLIQEPTDSSSLGAIVRHLTSSALADAALAAEYAVRAAEEAVKILGFAEAAEHYRTALELLVLVGDGDDYRRCQVLLGGGDALLADYAVRESRELYLQAARLADQLGAEDELNRAVAGIIAGTEFEVVDTDAERLMCMASEALGVDGHRWGDTTMTLLNVGRARMLPPGDPQRKVLARAAEISAQTCGDPAVAALALGTVLLVNWSPKNLGWRRLTVEQALTWSDQNGRSELGLELLNLKSAIAAEQGRLDDAGVLVSALAVAATQSRRPFLVALARMREAGNALLKGNYSEAERLSAEMIAVARESPNFTAARLAHTFVISRDRGLLHHLLPDLHQIVDLTGAAAWEAALSLAYLEVGQLDAGRKHLGHHIASGFATVADDWLWLSTMCYLGECAALLNDRDTAADLWVRLAPFRQRNVVVAHGVLSMGAAARVCGVLAMTAGWFDRACLDFELALDLNTRWEAWPSLIRTQLSYADLLDHYSARPGRPGAPSPDLLRQLARAKAAELGMAQPPSTVAQA